MAITQTLKHQIVVAYVTEHCTVGEIARRYKIHHKTVSRALAEYRDSAMPEWQQLITDAVQINTSMIGPYIPLIADIYAKDRHISSARLFQMMQERGYPGGQDHFRHQLVKLGLKPKRVAEAYLRLRTLPAEQAQVDWADFGTIAVGNTTYKIRAFIMVLSYSRRIFVKFMLNMHFDSFVRGHIEAFIEWGGIPRTVLCNNLKSAVIGRYKDLITFNDMYFKFAQHYNFSTQPVGIRKGNEKGRVERAVSYLRSNFFAGRDITTLEELNKSVKIWCDKYAMERKWAYFKELTVREAFAKEASLLSALPETHYEAVERIGAKVDKTAHVRSYSKGVAVQEGKHLDELRQYKQKAITHSLNYELTEKLGSARTYLQNAHQKGHNITTVVNAVNRLLKIHGADVVEAGLRKAIESESYHPSSLRHIVNEMIAGKESSAPIIPHQHHPLNSADITGAHTNSPHQDSKYDAI